MKHNKVINYINIKRLIVADKLLTKSLDFEIDNVYLMGIIFRVYSLLIKGAYVTGHTTAKHHYIPQFLLKKFKIKDTGNIYQYDRLKLPKPVSIKKEAACVQNLYSFSEKDTKNKTDFLEKQMFSNTLEKYASRIINKAIQQQDEDRALILTNLERSILTSFISSQCTRTPGFLFQIQLVVEYLNLNNNVPLEEMVKHDFFKKAFYDNQFNIDPAEVIKFALSNKKSLDNRELLIRYAVQIGDYISQFLFKRDLRILEVREPGFFFLSDTPAGIFNLDKGRGVGPFMWEINGNIVVYLPITPNYCIYFKEQKDDLPAGYFGITIERAISESIHEFAFSDRKSDKITRYFN